MKIEILQDHLTGYYRWVYYDGPEEIDEFYGEETSLGEVFEKIICCRTRNALNYCEDTSDTKEMLQ